MQVDSESPNLGDAPEASWYAYGRTNMGQRYSPLAQITPQNVGQLEEVWQYRTGDMKGPEDIGETTYQATPLKIGDTLYLCTPHNWLVALDADLGTKRWSMMPRWHRKASVSTRPVAECLICHRHQARFPPPRCWVWRPKPRPQCSVMPCSICRPLTPV
ncbi:hypothetical protein [Nitrincola sp. A-D6]|uniref:hypothetical protein n=1 Tax=Nitrincola sp. A-D6 TaxID=1545442 RepID=UPI003FA5DE32